MSSNNRRSNKRFAWAIPVGVALFWLALWAVAAASVGQTLLLPGPWPVLKTLWVLVREVGFWQTVWASILRAGGAFLGGILLGVVLAVCARMAAWFDALLRPAVSVVRATPVTSFIILALVWLQSSAVPVLAGVVMVLPVVWGNVTEGIRSTDPDLLEMARMYGFSTKQKLLKLYLPSVLPTFLAACETSMGLCWKATIAAEVLGIPRLAIGTQLRDAKVYLETEALFAWTLVVIVLSMVLERLFARGVRTWTRRGENPSMRRGEDAVRS